MGTNNVLKLWYGQPADIQAGWNEALAVGNGIWRYSC